MSECFKMKRCPICDATIHETTYSFCPYCGGVLEEMRVCL